MISLTLALLGSPLVKRDGEPINVGLRKAIALLAYLAVMGKRQPRTTLAALLWPGYDQKSALTGLRSILYELKKALGEDWFEVDHGTISLKSGTSLWVDVNHFDRLLAERRGHGHLKDEVCLACLSLLTEAVMLYRGDFLAGFTLDDSPAFDEWQRLQTNSLRYEAAHALEKLTHCHNVRGEFDQALVYARRWLALEPLRESAHHQVMQLCARIGRPGEALHQYQTCARLFEEGLGKLPGQVITQLYQDIKNDQLPPSPDLFRSPSHRLSVHDLPIQPTLFLGREKESANISTLLKDSACRLLTLAGPGGIGKTRLALQAAAENAQAFRHGVCFVPLVPLRSADLLAPTIVNAFGISFYGPADPEQQLLEGLRNKELLLVLDNFEHLLEGVELLEEILSAAPGVKLLITSRERLNLRWEWLLEIQGLEFPQDDEAVAIEDYSAVQLFLQSARRVRPDFSLAGAEKPYVVHVCRLLEGMPLGIELAAAWIQVLSCQEIAQEVASGLDLFVTALQDMPKRHHSLRAVFDHSWKLLSEKERSVFRKLSVFRGGFYREAAEKVTGAPLFILMSLVCKSFLHKTPTGRYEMLKVLRQYADEKLDQVPCERLKTYDLHCEYYTRFLGQREKQLGGEELQKALGEVGEEIENIRAAWGWAVSCGKVEEIAQSLKSLYLFYERRGWLVEAEAALGRSVERVRELRGGASQSVEQRIVLGRALARQGWFCDRLSRSGKARELLQESLSILRPLEVLDEVAFSLRCLGVVACNLGEHAEAERLHQESLAICRQIGDQRGVARCLISLGVVAQRLGEYKEARRLYQQSLTVYQKVGDRWGMMACLTNLGIVVGELGDHLEARRIHQRCLAVNREIGNQGAIANCLNNLGFAVCALGEPQEAKKCFREALEIAQDAQLVSVALEALVGITALLTQEGQRDQALECIVHTLDQFTIGRGKSEQVKRILSRIELHLGRALGRLVIYDEIRDMVQEIRDRAEDPADLTFQP